MAEIDRGGSLAGIVSQDLAFDRFPDWDEFNAACWASEDTVRRVA